MQPLRNKGFARIGKAGLLLAVLASVAACGIIGGGKDKRPKTPVFGNRVSILSSESGAEVDAALASMPVALPDPVANAEWSQPGGNAAKLIGHVALVAAPVEAWSASLTGSSSRARLAAAPVVAGGKLYAIDADARVLAFNAKTGARLWNTQMPSEGNGRSLFGGGVSVVEDKLFVTTGVGDVAALNAETGAVLWKKHPGGPLRGSPTLANGHAYVMSQDNQIFALDQLTGETQWNDSGTAQLTGVFGVAAPAAAQGTVIAGFSSGELTAYRYENGRDLWGDALSRTNISTSVAALTDIDADPVIDRGRVFAIGQGGRMASYELVSGQRLWEINVAGISTPAVVGDWVFVVTDDARLLCVARTTGKIRWISQLKRWRDEEDKKGAVRWTGPVAAGGRLILVSTEGDLVYINPADGAVAASRDMGHRMTLSPVVADNMLYILADDGRLTAYR
ncbi:MAG: PQQ-binding-like beta-propeller repeat protein [Sphingobium sp.]|nr:PQQ-binding-like beta-propeller repeat protein [Sphingobium sp.]MBP6112053.1 PQQ-binding-like beta-propeller repeat protein [Sphingobium sp.]MBP8671669.1 PQQ-binding-like beta-propeller repeat protein [Sphingobium sp.]MBP9158575.1 PQQ-binding-like beta-propeller repeat protein [Sphingobium sp.]MCC6482633.1 PQQ-binding-like beta-propeller repeat protein [Sphingomonadaceae bacterium]